MGLFKRASDVVESRVNQLLNKFEDPNAILDLSYEKMLDGLQQVKHHLADIVTEQKSLERQLENLGKELTQRDEEARAALKANREDLAKEALLRKQQSTERQRGLVEAHVHITAQVNKLKDAEQTFQDRIAAFKTQKEVTKASYSAAKAQVKIGEHMTGIGNQLGGVGEALQRANDKADQMMSRADAMESLVNEGILDDPLDKRDKVTRELDEIRRHSAVDDELERMKKELGQS
jgi:phage shock protein A